MSLSCSLSLSVPVLSLLPPYTQCEYYYYYYYYYYYQLNSNTWPMQKQSKYLTFVLDLRNITKLTTDLCTRHPRTEPGTQVPQQVMLPFAAHLTSTYLSFWVTYRGDWWLWWWGSESTPCSVAASQKGKIAIQDTKYPVL